MRQKENADQLTSTALRLSRFMLCRLVTGTILFLDYKQISFPIVLVENEILHFRLNVKTQKKMGMKMACIW